MQFTTDIPDEFGWAITAARKAYNAGLSATIITDTGQEIANPAVLSSDKAYLTFVIGAAIQSWAAQHAPQTAEDLPAYIATLQTAVAERSALAAELTELRASYEAALQDGELTADESSSLLTRIRGWFS